MKNASFLSWRPGSVALFAAHDHFVTSECLTFVVIFGASVALSAAGFATTKVAIRLQGDVAPQCAISNSQISGTTLGLGVTMALPDITRPGRKEYGFTVNCNAPFDYRLEARYGALTHEGGAAAPDGFITAVPYEVAMHIPTDRTTIDDRCPGDSIRAGQVRCPFSNSGDGVAMGSEGQLTLAWVPEGIPVAGKYTETLTITVGLRQ
jgi:hypothetical protein